MCSQCENLPMFNTWNTRITSVVIHSHERQSTLSRHITFASQLQFLKIEMIIFMLLNFYSSKTIPNQIQQPKFVGGVGSVHVQQGHVPYR